MGSCLSSEQIVRQPSLVHYEPIFSRLAVEKMPDIKKEDWVRGPMINPDDIFKEELKKVYKKELTEVKVDCEREGIMENLQKIHAAQLLTVDRVLKTDFYIT